MQIPELGFWEIAVLVAAAMLAGQFLRWIWRWCRRIRAVYDMARYRSSRADFYASGGGAAGPTDNRGERTEPDPEFYKDKDTHVRGMAEPKGFWSQLIMGEKTNLIREMIKIANSAEHRGYWQDRVEAQKRIDGQRQVGERDSSGR